MRLFPLDYEQLMTWLQTWPEEYQAALFAVIPKIWDRQKESNETNFGGDLFGPIIDPLTPDEYVATAVRQFTQLQDWFESFYRPIGFNQRWRRSAGSHEEALTFQTNFRPRRNGSFRFSHAGAAFLIDLGSVEKMAAWSEQASIRWQLEATGFFAAQAVQRGGQSILEIKEFIPTHGINGDPTLHPGGRYTSAVITGSDPYTPLIIGEMNRFLSDTVAQPSANLPIRFNFHSHPLAYDRPSIEDLRFASGDRFEFMYSSAKKRLVVWGDSSDQHIPDDYYRLPFETLEARRFFTSFPFP